MTDVNVNTTTNNNETREAVALLLRQFRALMQRNPRRVRRAVLALLWLMMWAEVGRNWLVMTGFASAITLVIRRDLRRRPAPVVEAESEPLDYPEQWFSDLCKRADVPKPLVTRHWPTKDGHAYRVIITGWVELGGRPTTVKAWLSFKGRLRDFAGKGCRYVAGEIDPDHGGETTVEFQGVHFDGWEWVDDTVRCEWEDCNAEASTHFLLPDDLGCALSCTAHAPKFRAYKPTDHHPVADVCDEHGWWIDSTEGKQGHCSLTPPPPTVATPIEHEPVRECPTPLEPLLAQDIPHIGPREGSGVLPPPDPSTRRPGGALPGSKGGALFDALVGAGRPVARGKLVELSGLSPGHVDKNLTAWADLGAVRKVAGTWEFVPSYRTSASVRSDGNEEAASE